MIPMTKLMAKAETLGAQVHEDWKKNYKAGPDGAKPRWKPTKFGRTWGKANEGKPFCKQDGANCSVDIAALTFEELPGDWQYENYQAALVALQAAAEALEVFGSFTPQALTAAAVKIHAYWTARRLESYGAKKAAELNDWDRQQLGLCVPYGELPDAEKEKDLVQARMAAKEIEAMAG